MKRKEVWDSRSRSAQALPQVGEKVVEAQVLALHGGDARPSFRRQREEHLPFVVGVD